MASRENALGRLHRHRHRRRLSLGHEQHALELGHGDRCTVRAHPIFCKDEEASIQGLLFLSKKRS
jgi:hypothetical protein